MGFFTDLLKEAVDSATGGAISYMEANKAIMETDKAIRQFGQLNDDANSFNQWFKGHSKKYVDLRDKLNSGSYRVDRRIFHANWLTGEAEWDGKSIVEEDNENNRRRRLIEDAIKKQSYDYVKKAFKNYLLETENSILDSYNTFCMFQSEMSHLATFQKGIVDSVYLTEVKELLGAAGQEIAFTKIKDFAWQIERHKTHAGHAIVLLLLAKLVYHSNSGFVGDIKTRIENVISQTEDTIIDNTYKMYLTEDAGDSDADTLLKTGKEFFTSGEPEKAFAYFLSAAKKGNVEAQYRAGLCFEKGYGVYENKENAICLYKKSAENNNPISKYYLAKVYHCLLPESKQDYNKAFELYKTAFNAGVAEAAKNIGHMYAHGTGVDKNDVTAVEWYEKGAAAGSLWAMYHLYRAYMNGIGVEANSEIAEQWFIKCVNCFELPKENETEDITNDFYGNLLLPGYDSIFGGIAKEYYNGSSVISKDVDKAITWFEKGAAIGNVDSLNETVSIPQLSWGNNRCKWR